MDSPDKSFITTAFFLTLSAFLSMCYVNEKHVKEIRSLKVEVAELNHDLDICSSQNDSPEETAR